MLTLVEPLMLDGLASRPDLGCAMLVAVCRQHGIPVTLVQGQTRWLRAFFLDGHRELWEILSSLSDEDLRSEELIEYRRRTRKAGYDEFAAELAGLYREILIEKNPRTFFQAAKIGRLSDLARYFLTVCRRYLRKFGDRQIGIVQEYVREIIRFNPRVVGFSQQYRFDAITRAVRRELKERLSVPVIVGGSLTPFLDRRQLPDLFERECFDYLVAGPGEKVLPELLRALAAGEPAGQIRGVYQKDRLRGDPAPGDDAEWLAVAGNLDDLPEPDFTLFSLDRYLPPLRILPLQTSRGCSWRKCAFCSHHALYGNSYSEAGAGRIADMLVRLQQKYGCSHFVLHDEDIPPRRARQLCQAIEERGRRDLSLFAYARPVAGYRDPSLLSRMKQAGFAAICWGVESGDQRVLNLMKKGTAVPAVEAILYASARAGIANLCFIMFGFPGETEEEAERTVVFLQRNADVIDHVLAGTFCLQSRSPLARILDGQLRGATAGGENRKPLPVPANEFTFFERFSKRQDVGAIEVTNPVLRYVMPGHPARMLHFLKASRQLRPAAGPPEELAAGEPGTIFPLLPGEANDLAGTPALYSPDLGRTLICNRLHPPGPVLLSREEHRFYGLADGTRSLDAIARIIGAESDSGENQHEVQTRCMHFFIGLVQQRRALAFAKPWQDLERPGKAGVIRDE